MTLTKADIIDSIHNNNTDLNKRQATDAFESTMEIIKKTLVSGEDVLISRFGKFYVKAKKQRLGRNPQTGDDMMIEPRRVITFQCSGVLRDKIDGGE